MSIVSALVQFQISCLSVIIMSFSSNVPRSPRVTNIRRAALYKKSPGKSPLREMIKSRCQVSLCYDDMI